MRSAVKTSILTIFVIFSCTNRISRLVKSNTSPHLEHSAKRLENTFQYSEQNEINNNFSPATMDTESGDMIANRELNEITIYSVKNNFAERGGVVSLHFAVTLGKALLNSHWQAILRPVILSDRDSTHLSPILITGSNFIKHQSRSYKRFEKYLSSIIPDNASFYECFTDLNELSLFLARNLNHSRVLIGQENDTLKTVFGVSEKMIVDHYVKYKLIEKNNRKKDRKEEVFKKIVRNPRLENARLDSILEGINGDFNYFYSQEFKPSGKTDRVKLFLECQIRDSGGMNFQINNSDTIDFKLSSLVNLIDTTPGYLLKIIERTVCQEYTSNIKFNLGSSIIDTSLTDNKIEINQMVEFIKSSIGNKDYTPDSLHIVASSSPEGSFKLNSTLSKNRALSVKKIIDGLGIPDSIIDIKTIPENWDLIHSSVTGFKEDDIKVISNIMCYSNLDKREILLKRHKSLYEKIKEDIYPKLRYVQLKVRMQRRDMIKDTVHTLIPDTLYNRGTELLQNRDYEEAYKYLSRYSCVNTAINLISLGEERMALELLQNLHKSALPLYLCSIIYSRIGDEERAVEYFIKAKERDIKFAYRGGLDPEISYLIKKYNLNKDLFE